MFVLDALNFHIGAALQQPTELRSEPLLVYPDNKTVRFEEFVLLLH